MEQYVLRISAFLPFSFSRLFRLQIAVNVIFFQFPIAQAGSFRRNYTIELMVYVISLASSKFGQRLLVKKSKLGDLSQSETTTYFE